MGVVTVKGLPILSRHSLFRGISNFVNGCVAERCCHIYQWILCYKEFLSSYMVKEFLLSSANLRLKDVASFYEWILC